uniref:C-type lectin domain-containing protein n=1 Tax=Oryzias melastigma TaxID=30732 RepID=A0A3B3CN23_ORYME
FSALRLSCLVNVSFILKRKSCEPMSICQMCPKDWIQFKESCYYFDNPNALWKTWDESRQFCQSKKSDLVVISKLRELRK